MPEYYQLGIGHILAIGIVAISGITILTIHAEDESLIPSWIKNTAQFWVEDQVSDSEFINALQYMISNEIIQIPGQSDDKIKEIQDENERLRDEIKSLKSQLSGQMQIDFEEYYSKAFGFSMNIPEGWYKITDDRKCTLLLSEFPSGVGSTICVTPVITKLYKETGQKFLEIIHEKKYDACIDAYKESGYLCEGFKARKLDWITKDKVTLYYISYYEDRGTSTQGTKITHTFWELLIPTSNQYTMISMKTTEDNIDEYEMIMDEIISSYKVVSKKYG